MRPFCHRCEGSVGWRQAPRPGSPSSCIAFSISSLDDALELHMVMHIYHSNFRQNPQFVNLYTAQFYKSKSENHTERVGEWGLVKISVPALTLKANDSINTFLETSYNVGFQADLFKSGWRRGKDS